MTTLDYVALFFFLGSSASFLGVLSFYEIKRLKAAAKSFEMQEKFYREGYIWFGYQNDPDCFGERAFDPTLTKGDRL